MTQLELLPATPRLTGRQQHALDVIAVHGPIGSGELGRALGANPRYLTESGREVGAALRRKGLVRYSRIHAGWVTAGSKPSRKPSSQTDEIPF